MHGARPRVLGAGGIVEYDERGDLCDCGSGDNISLIGDIVHFEGLDFEE